MREAAIYGLQALLTVVGLVHLKRGRWPHKALWSAYLAGIGLGDVGFYAFNYSPLSVAKAPAIYFALTMTPYLVGTAAGIAFLWRSASSRRGRGGVFEYVPPLLALLVSSKFVLVPLTRKLMSGGLTLDLAGIGASLLESLVASAVGVHCLIDSDEPRLVVCAVGLLIKALISWGINVQYLANPVSSFSYTDIVWFVGVCLSAYPSIRWADAARPDHDDQSALGRLVRYWLMTLVLLPVAALSILGTLDPNAAPAISMAIFGGMLFAVLAGRILVDRMRSSEELARLVTASRLAAQVAHDIRAPLAALAAVDIDMQAVSSERRAIIRGAVERIDEISQTLTRTNEIPFPQPLAPLIEAVAAEKRVLLNGRMNVSLEVIATASANVRVQAAEFKRVFSNLLDNAVEAMGSGGGAVRAELAVRGGAAQLAVTDDGRGIPPEILSRLGERGETHGKAGGSGLGLHHAKTCAASWGGTLDIRSELGKGTKVVLTLPLHQGSGETVLIDDDELVRLTWTLAAGRAGKRLMVYAGPDEFYSDAGMIDRAAAIYIDSDLGDRRKGQEELPRIHALGFREIYLSTGFEPERFDGIEHLRGVVGKTPPWD